MVIDVFAKSKSEVEEDCRICAEKIGKVYSLGLIVIEIAFVTDSVIRFGA